MKPTTPTFPLLTLLASLLSFGWSLQLFKNIRTTLETSCHKVLTQLCFKVKWWFTNLLSVFLWETRILSSPVFDFSRFHHLTSVLLTKIKSSFHLRQQKKLPAGYICIFHVLFLPLKPRILVLRHAAAAAHWALNPPCSVCLIYLIPIFPFNYEGGLPCYLTSIASVGWCVCTHILEHFLNLINNYIGMVNHAKDHSEL